MSFTCNPQHLKRPPLPSDVHARDEGTLSALVETARLEVTGWLFESNAALPLKTVAVRVGLEAQSSMPDLFLRHVSTLSQGLPLAIWRLVLTTPTAFLTPRFTPRLPAAPL